MADLTDEIEENAAAPKRVAIDGVSVDEHSLPDQIDADRYLKGQTAASKPHAGLRFVKLIPPGGG
jgi:hypothetical protein